MNRPRLSRRAWAPATGIAAVVAAIVLAASPTGAAVGWTAPARVFNLDFAQPAMVVDAHGHAHIAARGDSGVWYLTNKSGSWTRTRLTTDHTHNGNPVTATNPVIALDGSTGHITVAYEVVTDTGGAPCCNAVLTYRTKANGGWSRSHLVPAICSNSASIAVRHGKLSVAAMRTSSAIPSEVWFCTNASGSWTSQRLGPQPNDEKTELSDPSLALDSHGRPDIAYLRSTDFGATAAVYYAHGATRKGDFTWEKASIAASSYSTPSLALDSHDRPRIAFAAKLKTWFAMRNASGWHKVAVMSGHSDTALTVDSSDRPHIAATDECCRSLWYATRAGGMWRTKHLDHHSNVTGVSIGTFHARVYVSYEIEKPGAPTDGPPRVWFTHSTH